MTLPADFGRSLSEPKQKPKLNSKSKPTRTAEQKAARKQATDAKNAARLQEQRQADLSRRSPLAQADDRAAHDAEQRAAALADAERQQAEHDAAIAAQQQREAQERADLSAVALAKEEALAKAELEEAWEQAADAIHRQLIAFKSIDDRERLALSALEAKRRSPGGRAVEFFMGGRHFEAQRKAIMARFEAEREKLRCDFPSEFPIPEGAAGQARPTSKGNR